MAPPQLLRRLAFWTCLGCVLMVGVFLLYAFLRQRALAAEHWELLSRAETRGFGESYGAYFELFRRIDSAALLALADRPRDTLALQAAWQGVLRGEAEGPAPRSRRQTFLELFERRVGVKAPEWWVESFVREAKSWVRPGSTPGVYPYRQTGVGQGEVPVGMTLVEREDSLTLTAGPEFITFPRSLLVLSSSKEVFGCACPLFTPERCYLAIHWGTDGQYDLHCFVQPGGKHLWSSRVQGGQWHDVAGDKPMPLRVSLVERGGRVFVFGECAGRFHAEGFRTDNGDNLFRFVTLPLIR